jgi:uncharacterized protein with PIN domain
MKFIADCMLGKLAKWLRILGFDAAFFSKIDDDDLLSLAKAEGRILLTRDTDLSEKSGEVQTFFVRSEVWRDQVLQVLDELDIWNAARPYSRCLECNTDLKPLPKERARNLVSAFVFEQSEAFALCPDCGRVFWKGSHFEDMNEKIIDILKKKK